METIYQVRNVPLSSMKVGDLVRWGPYGHVYPVTEVYGTGFDVMYEGNVFAYSFNAGCKLVERLPQTAPARAYVTPTAIPRITPQAHVVLSHIKRAGSITQREAIADHSVQSLTRRIAELRDAGFPVRGEQRKHPLTGQRYMRYSLAV